jgi:hypothetical protein
MTTIATDEPKKHRGFASAANTQGRAHEFTTEEARAAPSDRGPPSLFRATETKVPA